jgi:hypothetical protein
MRWRGARLLCFKLERGLRHGHETLAPPSKPLTAANKKIGLGLILQSLEESS